MTRVERQLQAHVNVFSSDSGGEFSVGTLQQWFVQQGIHWQSSVSTHPAQNGLAEWMNRTLKEHLTSVPVHANLPYVWWSLA